MDIKNFFLPKFFSANKKSRIFNWAIWTILGAAVLAAGGAVWYYSDLNQKQTEKKQATYPLDIVIKALPAEEAIQFLYKGEVGKITYSEEYKNSILIDHVNFILKDGRNFISGPIPHILSAVERCGEPCNDLEKVSIPKNSILNTCGPEPPATCSANTRLTCLDGKWECKTEQKVDTSSWKNYSNPKIKFKYPKEWVFDSENIFKDSNGNTIMSLFFTSTDVLGISFGEANSNNSRCESIKSINAPIIIDWQSDNQAVGETYTTQGEKVFITLHIINNKTKQIFRTIMSTVNIP